AVCEAIWNVPESRRAAILKAILDRWSITSVSGWKIVAERKTARRNCISPTRTVFSSSFRTRSTAAVPVHSARFVQADQAFSTFYLLQVSGAGERAVRHNVLCN